MEETKGSIIEVRSVCGECWKEDKIIIPLYGFDEEKDLIVSVHNHEEMKKRKEILEALKDERNKDGN